MLRAGTVMRPSKVPGRFARFMGELQGPIRWSNWALPAISGIFGAYPQENHLDVLAEQVVNNTGDLPAYYPISRLWNKYRDEFVNILAEPSVRPNYDIVVKAGQNIQENTLPLLTYLKEQRLQLSLKYGEPYAALTSPANVS